MFQNHQRISSGRKGEKAANSSLESLQPRPCCYISQILEIKICTNTISKHVRSSRRLLLLKYYMLVIIKSFTKRAGLG